MMKRLLLFSAFLASCLTAAAREYASDAACRAAEQFLAEAGAVAVVDGGMYLDGGSLSYVLETAAGRRFTFVLSPESQRRQPNRVLSLDEGRHIVLVPDAVYGSMVKLLTTCLSKGQESGLQDRWPDFAPEALGLRTFLASTDGAPRLDPLYALGVARLKAAHEAHLARRAKETKP